MLSNHLIFCCLLLLPSIFPRIRVFSNESVLCIRWPKCWVSALALVLSMNIQGWFPLGLNLKSHLQHHNSKTSILQSSTFFIVQPSHLYMATRKTMLLFSFSVVSKLCDPMDCSMPGFPVHHQLLELAQTHVHRVSDATNHLILCYSLLFLPSIFPSFRGFSTESILHIKWPKHLHSSFSISPSSEQSRLISFRINWFWSSCSSRDSQESSPALQFKNINSSVLSLLYGPALTTIHDYWKNNSFD